MYAAHVGRVHVPRHHQDARPRSRLQLVDRSPHCWLFFHFVLIYYLFSNFFCIYIVTTGPGVASSYYFQISTEQVLLALQGSLEAEELENWKALVQKRIEMPREAYNQWAMFCLEPFGASLSTDSEYRKKAAQRLKRFLSAKLSRQQAASLEQGTLQLEWIDDEKAAQDLKPGQVRRHRLLLMDNRTADGGQQFQVRS